VRHGKLPCLIAFDTRRDACSTQAKGIAEEFSRSSSQDAVSRAVLVPESPDRIISFSSNLANGWRTVFLTVNSILRARAQMDLGVSDGLILDAVMKVVQRDKALALVAAGYSDLDTQSPMRTDAIFDI
jgi:hypothetical protein